MADARAELRAVMLIGSAALILLTTVAGAWACTRPAGTHGSADPGRKAIVDPATLIDRPAAGLSAAGPYRDPTREERARAARAARSLLGGPGATTRPGLGVRRARLRSPPRHRSGDRAPLQPVRDTRSR